MNYFKDLIESIPDFRKIKLLMFLIKNDNNLLKEVGSSKNDIIQLSLEVQNFLYEKNDEYLDYIENEKESISEKILNK